MLVELVELRREGVKLSRDEVRTAKPRLVELAIYRLSGQLRATYSIPWLPAPGHGTWPPVLEPASVVAMRDQAFLVVGLETVGKWGAERKLPQAWWCRVPERGGAARPAPVPAPRHEALPIPIPERWRAPGHAE
jgi:hypothetical protein